MSGPTYNCRSCNAVLDPDYDAWGDTVNLTPDVLMIGSSIALQFEEYQESEGADWCNVECFGRWLRRHVNEVDLDQLEEIEAAR